MKWNISVTEGKEKKKDSVSSGVAKMDISQAFSWKMNNKCKKKLEINRSREKKKSKTEHEQFCLKKGGPSSKFK